MWSRRRDWQTHVYPGWMLFGGRVHRWREDTGVAAPIDFEPEQNLSFLRRLLNVRKKKQTNISPDVRRGLDSEAYSPTLPFIVCCLLSLRLQWDWISVGSRGGSDFMLRSASHPFLHLWMPFGNIPPSVISLFMSLNIPFSILRPFLSLSLLLFHSALLSPEHLRQQTQRLILGSI